MYKLWVIASKDIRTRFTDRTLLIIMLAAPLLISTIIGLAFGGLGESNSPVRNIPVAVINNDKAAADGTSYGVILATLLKTGKPPADTNSTITKCPQSSSQSNGSSNAGGMTLGELIKGTTFDENTANQLVANKSIDPPTAAAGTTEYLAEAARAAVDKGLYTAVVIIPGDFSKALESLADQRQAPASSTITVYGNGGNALSAGIVRSVIDSIDAQLVSGNTAIAASVGEVVQQNPAAMAGITSQKLQRLFVCAFAPGSDLINVTNIPVQAAPTNTAGSLMVTIGSAQALFFALFTGQNGILSMYDERRNGTLQRILISPTPRWIVLAGKLIGVFVSVVFQLLVLAMALTLVGSFMEGRPVFIWGSNIVMLFLLLLAVAVAVSGLGMFLAGIIKGIEQANVISSVLNIALGVIGGAFGFQLARSIAQFSLVYWARNAFDLLAAGRGDITLNLLVLFVEGAVLFGIGLLLFNRKFEV